MPIPALGALLTWVAVVLATRYVSLASLAAAVALCVMHLFLTPNPFSEENRKQSANPFPQLIKDIPDPLKKAESGEAWPIGFDYLLLTGFCVLAAALVFLRHRANIQRLLHGNENRLQEFPALQPLGKTLHVLALGLWFGSTIFFSFVVAPSLFHTFETIELYNLPKEFQRQDPQVNGPREQGTRTAGKAVGPIFPLYFLIQGMCGLVAIVTCLGWTRAHPQEKVHKIRCLVLVPALIMVLAGMVLEQEVQELRKQRHLAVDAYLYAKTPTAKEVSAMKTAKDDFSRAHLYSLFLNLGTIVLVAVGMALAAHLPRAAMQKEPEKDTSAQALGSAITVKTQAF